MQYSDIKEPDNVNCRIWRYMDFQQFFYLIRFRQLTFALPSLFDDTLEGVLTQQFKREVIDRIKCGNRESIETEFHNLFFYSEESKLHKYFSERVYVSCWHMSESENMAMWKLYGGVHKGVAIVSTYKKLSDVLSANPNIQLGCIDYIESYAHPGSKYLPGFITKYFRKRKGYESEKEVRAVYIHPLNENGLNSKLYAQNINIADLIERVVISPYANAEFEKSIKELISGVVICDKSGMSCDIDDPMKLAKLHKDILILLKKYSIPACQECNGRGYKASNGKNIFCEICFDENKWPIFKNQLLSIIGKSK